LKDEDGLTLFVVGCWGSSEDGRDEQRDDDDSQHDRVRPIGGRLYSPNT